MYLLNFPLGIWYLLEVIRLWILYFWFCFSVLTFTSKDFQYGGVGFLIGNPQLLEILLQGRQWGGDQISSSPGQRKVEWPSSILLVGSRLCSSYSSSFSCSSSSFPVCCQQGPLVLHQLPRLSLRQALLPKV